MLLTVGEFTKAVVADLDDLVERLQEETGRFGDAEAKSWRSSLSHVAAMLDDERFGALHLGLGAIGGIDVEYRLPASSSWCDLALLGRGPAGPAAFLVELKDWETTGDRPGPRPGLVEHQGTIRLHPSEQVRGYVEYCRRFHGAVVGTTATVTGCAFFTNLSDLAPYRARPHEDLVREYPVFNLHDTRGAARLPRLLADRLVGPDPDFAHRFHAGGYRQDRNFVTQVADSIRDSDLPAFVLLDEQRRGFEVCLAAIDRHLDDPMRGKCVVVIEGPPGSGKSVIAARLWAHLVGDSRIDGSVAFVSTSNSQKSNWQSLFRTVSRDSASAGIVIPANQFNPGLTPLWVKGMRAKGHVLELETWRRNLEVFLADRNPRIADDEIAVSIVDEAHALIDPTTTGARGIPPSGWSLHAGPQAWHVMRASRVTIFLLDGSQSYRDNETTRRNAIEEWARDLGIEKVDRVELVDTQFRCGGSAEYVDWLETLLGLREGPARMGWRAAGDGTGSFGFDVVADPAEMEERLRGRIASGSTARIVASYARPWRSKGHAAPHGLAGDETDFSIAYDRDGSWHRWDRPWNFVVDENYASYVQAPVGSRMHSDPLSEVGCPYVVRGFDYDFLGVLWLRDLVWRNGRWLADPTTIFESAWPKTLAAAKRDPEGAGMAALVDRLARGYRILLTRAIRGVFVWIEDDETREHVQSLLGSRVPS